MFIITFFIKKLIVKARKVLKLNGKIRLSCLQNGMIVCLKNCSYSAKTDEIVQELPSYKIPNIFTVLFLSQFYGLAYIYPGHQGCQYRKTCNQ